MTTTTAAGRYRTAHKNQEPAPSLLDLVKRLNREWVVQAADGSSKGPQVAAGGEDVADLRVRSSELKGVTVPAQSQLYSYIAKSSNDVWKDRLDASLKFADPPACHRRAPTSSSYPRRGRRARPTSRAWPATADSRR